MELYNENNGQRKRYVAFV